MFYIPSNFDDSGRIFNGMFKTRNFIEAVGLTFIYVQILSNVLKGVDFKTKIFIYIVTTTPIIVFSIIGINEDSLTQFIGAFIRFLKNRKRLRYRRIDINEPNREN